MQDRNSIVEQMADAFRMVLSEGEAGKEEQRAILIKRIPIICNDVIEMKNNIEATRSDVRWIKWLVTGLVGGIGVIFVAIVIASLQAH